MIIPVLAVNLLRLWMDNSRSDGWMRRCVCVAVCLWHQVYLQNSIIAIPLNYYQYHTRTMPLLLSRDFRLKKEVCTEV